MLLYQHTLCGTRWDCRCPLCALPCVIAAEAASSYNGNAQTCPALIFDVSSIKAEKEGQPTIIILGHSGQFSSTSEAGTGLVTCQEEGSIRSVGRDGYKPLHGALRDALLILSAPFTRLV